MENILHKTKTRFHLMLIELIFPSIFFRALLNKTDSLFEIIAKYRIYN